MKNKHEHPIGYSGRTIGKLIQNFKPRDTKRGPGNTTKAKGK